MTSCQTTKRCSRCKEEKPLSDFSKDKRNKDGLDVHCRACKKLYNDAQKDYRTEYLRVYRKRGNEADLEYHKIKRANYRAAVYDCPGNVSREDVSDCLDFFSHECAYSGVPLTMGYSLDHIVPLSKGGENTIRNIVPCLTVLNIRKATMDWEPWYAEQPFYSESRRDKIREWINKREG